MKPLISPASMRTCEEQYFRESGVKSIDIMENAAQALANAVSSALPEGSSIYFACGTGGNGGDGTACARLLHKKYRCTIIQPKDPKSPDAIENLRRAKECGIPVFRTLEQCMPVQGNPFNPDAWVDALFGTGLSRAPEGSEAALIEIINAHRHSGAKVFSADIPSGLNGATGKAYSPCVCSDHTVTFQYIKTGLVLADGLDVCGEITVADVGFPKEAFSTESFDAQLFGPCDAHRFLPMRRRNIHKGNCGHLLIVAGSFGMAGAAAMCAKAALRSGVGLLTIACAQSIVPVLQTLIPQAMCIPLDEEDDAISIGALPKLKDALCSKDAVVVGPGLARRVPPEIIRAILERDLPAVVDADALNILSENRELLGLLNYNHVLTPHPGEAARLLGAIHENPIETAKELTCLSDADPSPIILYKGASTIICERHRNVFEPYISRSGCCGMARGGSGDILSGILGALLAEKQCIRKSYTAASASEIHGLAGELAQEKYGSRCMNAMDIIEFLPEVFPQ